MTETTADVVPSFLGDATSSTHATLQQFPFLLKGKKPIYILSTDDSVVFIPLFTCLYIYSFLNVGAVIVWLYNIETLREFVCVYIFLYRVRPVRRRRLAPFPAGAAARREEAIFKSPPSFETCSPPSYLSLISFFLHPCPSRFRIGTM